MKKSLIALVVTSVLACASTAFAKDSRAASVLPSCGTTYHGVVTPRFPTPTAPPAAAKDTSGKK